MTLLETLITTALFSLVIVGVYLLYTTMQSTLSRGELKTDLQQNARVGLDRMVQEIRMAGYSAGAAIPSAEPALRGATRTCLSLVTANPTSGAAVQVTYALSGSVLRRNDGAGLQPLAESVALLAFTYFDASSQVLTPASVTGAPCASTAGLSAAQLQQVRRVAILLKTLGSRPGVAPEFFALTSDVRLRNR